MVARVIPRFIPQQPGDPNDWFPNYPNPADFQFDYYRLLALAKENNSGIGTGPAGAQRTVAVIGAGAAGMTAARELYRAGYFVAVYEASDRICGRHYTQRIGDSETGMELGAMRFPFFSEPGSKNSVFDYYLNAEAPGLTSPFPNPGTAPFGTGIYLNRGWGPNDQFYPNPTMILWNDSPNDYNPPPNPALKAVYDKEIRFVDFFTRTVATKYGTAEWPAMWQQIANQYDKMTFSDLVFAPIVDEYQNDGWLGGFGMNDAESELFYVIGAGDGSWGAFYEIAALWFIRCVMFGFNSNLQTMAGIANPQSLPYWNDDSLQDSDHNPLPPPQYFGIQSLVEWLMYVPPPGMSRSFYDAAQDNAGASLRLNAPVSALTAGDNVVSIAVNGELFVYDYVVLTPQIWASQLGVALNGFSPNDLPDETIAARNEQHVIASCKVFFPLTEPYWRTGSGIPQLIVTDTFVQDAYGVQWTDDDPGVLLASYTWEDDALKLIPYSNDDVARMVLAELDAITSSTLGGKKISDYVASTSEAVVFQWTTQVGYNGCAKLYRQRNWAMNYALLAYNQQYSQSSRLYLAGETFGVEGGWTEPALRLALDAVIRIIQHSGGTFVNGFDVNTDYPSYDTTFQPDESYNVNTNDA